MEIITTADVSAIWWLLVLVPAVVVTLILLIGSPRVTGYEERESFFGNTIVIGVLATLLFTLGIGWSLASQIELNKMEALKGAGYTNVSEPTRHHQGFIGSLDGKYVNVVLIETDNPNEYEIHHRNVD